MSNHTNDLLLEEISKITPYEPPVLLPITTPVGVVQGGNSPTEYGDLDDKGTGEESYEREGGDD